MAEPRRVVLAGDTDFDGFRSAARALLQQRVAPADVQWAVAGDAEPELFAIDDVAPTPCADASPLRGPPEVITLCRDAALHAERTRFALIYRLLWRLQHEPALRHDPLHADVVAVRRMAHAVTHEMHKMKAYVRFRPVLADDGGEPLHIAWLEPEHHVVDAVAPFFARRFAGMRWAILTPRRCIHWDGQRIEHRPGARAQDAPGADADEALWLTYYRSIFNPARLNVAALQRHMPRRWWPNLPEAALIGELERQAPACSGAMLAREPRPAARRLPASPAMPAPHKPIATITPIVADDAAAQLQAQRNASAGCRACPIGALATQTVWGEGPLNAALMLVGEQPGDQEDLQGKPFVGPAGQLLDRALAQLGWARSLLYVTNAVKHFKYEPRGKRRVHKTPAQKEADACRHWLDSEIALVAPRRIVALGATAARQLLGRAVAVTRERGQWLSERADGVPVLVTLHPSALLRADPADREANFAAWLHDLQQVGTAEEAAAVAGRGGGLKG